MTTTNELFCRCGHSEYLHVMTHPKGWALASYPCADTSKPGACPCLDFSLAPRKRPAIPTCANGSSCLAPGGCGNPIREEDEWWVEHACPEHRDREKKPFKWGPPPWHPCQNCDYRRILGKVEMGPAEFHDTQERKDTV